MKIVNGTAHKINIYAEADTVSVQGGRKLILKEGAVPIRVIEPGTNLNCQKRNRDLPNYLSDSDIPLVGGVEFMSYDPIPHADLVIVSNLYRAAVAEIGGMVSVLATVHGAVYASEDDLRPCGCLGLAVG